MDNIQQQIIRFERETLSPAKRLTAAIEDLADVLRKIHAALVNERR